MSLTENIAHWLERSLSWDRRGRRLLPMPWDNLEEAQRQELPKLLQWSVRPAMLFAVLAAGCLVIGLLLHGRALTAFGFGFLCTEILAYRRSLFACSALNVVSVSAPETVCEAMQASFKVTIRNESKWPSGDVIVRFIFTGSSQRQRYAVQARFAPKETRTVAFAVDADLGMGDFLAGGIQIVHRDSLGLFPVCVGHSWEATVKVIPSDSTIVDFPVEHVGLAFHSGPFESNAAGGSSSFLGIRPWRTGDSIRQIDWKRSQRLDELYVKEFEKTTATDATFFIDQMAYGHAVFKGISTFATMKQSALALGRYFLGQQFGVQLVSGTHELGLGGGLAQSEALASVVETLELQASVDFTKLVADNLERVAPESIVVLFFCTNNVAIEELLGSLLQLHDRQVETVLVAFDTREYARAVRNAANLDPGGLATARIFEPLLKNPLAGEGLGGLLHSLAKQTYVIKPGQTLVDLCAA